MPRILPTFPMKIQLSSSEFSRTIVRKARRRVRRLVRGSSGRLDSPFSGVFSSLVRYFWGAFFAVRLAGCFLVGSEVLTGSSPYSSSFAAKMSRYLNWLQAEIKELGVLLSPMPSTVMPDSRSRAASRVKSLSEETRQKPSTFPE